MMRWLNIDDVIGESALGNQHYQMVWFCYEIMIYRPHHEDGTFCMDDILIAPYSIP